MQFNSVFLENIYSHTFNFKKLLKYKDTIIWKNCDNLNINIDSKINKLIFIKCSNIKLELSDAVIGLEIENSSNFEIKIKKNKKIASIELYKSHINLKKNKKQNFFLLCEKSKIKYI